MVKASRSATRQRIVTTVATGKLAECFTRKLKAFRTTKSIIAFKPLKKVNALDTRPVEILFLSFLLNAFIHQSISSLCCFLIMTIDSAFFFLYDKRRTTLCCQLKKRKKRALFGGSSRLSEEKEG